MNGCNMKRDYVVIADNGDKITVALINAILIGRDCPNLFEYDGKYFIFERGCSEIPDGCSNSMFATHIWKRVTGLDFEEMNKAVKITHRFHNFKHELERIAESVGQVLQYRFNRPVITPEMAAQMPCPFYYSCDEDL